LRFGNTFNIQRNLSGFVPENHSSQYSFPCFSDNSIPKFPVLRKKDGEEFSVRKGIRALKK
jgi:hypothetical protein